MTRMKEQATQPLLSLENLTISFADQAVVQGVSFNISKGETLALVGESGSGKSMTALSILGLCPEQAQISPQSKILFEGQDLLKMSKNELRNLRSSKVGIVFQEPMTSLNPVQTLGQQLDEALRLNPRLGLAAAQRRARILELLEKVGLDQPQGRLSSYPHQLSGGQRQRVMIAIALSKDPQLLIADEPTTALDVTIQEQILELLLALQAEQGMALLFITHNLGIVRKMAQRTLVMRKGSIIEANKTEQLFSAPQQNYTRQLISASLTSADSPALNQEETEPLLSAKQLSVFYEATGQGFWRKNKQFCAVDRVDLTLKAGQTLGIVGESGSGKSTLGAALLRLVASQGQILLSGQDISAYNFAQMKPIRAKMQIVFQDPYGALSPRLSVAEIIGEGLTIDRREPDADKRDALVVKVMQELGLDPKTRFRFPHEFSGGQRQRIAIARVLILEPQILVLDEPTSALDLSVQAQIIALLKEIQQNRKISYIFISHDLGVVRAMAHHVIVMKQGEIVEQASTAQIFNAPQQDYTKTLLRAAMLD